MVKMTVIVTSSAVRVILPLVTSGWCNREFDLLVSFHTIRASGLFAKQATQFTQSIDYAEA